MPITIQPKTVIEPDVPYDKSLVYLSISPIVHDPNNIEAALSLRVVPYRILSDGSIDQNDKMAYNENVGNVFERSASDPALAQAAEAVWSAIQSFLTARNV